MIAAACLISPRPGGKDDHSLGKHENFVGSFSGVSALEDGIAGFRIMIGGMNLVGLGL